ncbi:hypothetical protein BSL78_05545 [Apostichopus japonicus]|uniref:Uncharacterized protein n=1 Tax=Stichopus japonicus TaxID=307972 RepID=A0A2G8LBE1_STIJA|nr:hypothetical protein BSL78_05545 [Apostichopus japonicus]
MLAVLDSTIADHFLLFKELFPEERLKPKRHYLLHYADRPIKSNLVMRFEAKHQELKSYATISKNFKNICLTVASRVQMKQACYLFAENFLKPELEIKVASKNCCLEKDITQWVSIQGVGAKTITTLTSPTTMKILVEYGHSRKVIELENEDTLFSESLYNTLCIMMSVPFSSEETFFQYFDEDFKSWLTLSLEPKFPRLAKSITLLGRCYLKSVKNGNKHDKIKEILHRCDRNIEALR